MGCVDGDLDQAARPGEVSRFSSHTPWDEKRVAYRLERAFRSVRGTPGGSDRESRWVRGTRWKVASVGAPPRWVAPHDGTSVDQPTRAGKRWISTRSSFSADSPATCFQWASSACVTGACWRIGIGERRSPAADLSSALSTAVETRGSLALSALSALPVTEHLIPAKSSSRVCARPLHGDIFCAPRPPSSGSRWIWRAGACATGRRARARGSGKIFEVTEFLARLLQHVPEPRLHQVRYYGLQRRPCSQGRECSGRKGRIPRCPSPGPPSVGACGARGPS